VIELGVCREHMKVTLIQPENPFDIAYASGLMRPLGLHLLASYLEKHGFEVEILDLRVERHRGMSPARLIQDGESRLFGITGFTAARFAVAEIAREIKRQNPRARIVVGGWHFAHCARETLERIREIDIVVKGMGLSSIVAIASAVDRNGPMDGIPSIAYRDKEQIIEKPEEPFRINLDEIPFYTGFRTDDYTERLRAYPKPVRAMGLYSSLGCPAKCVFCSRVFKGYYLKGPRKFVDEIALCMDRFGVEAFNFVDNTFTGHRDHATAICREIISRNIKVKWWCESRVDVPLEILDNMREAGCVAVSAGAESGSDRILSGISKGITAEKIRRFCEKCNELGIFVDCFFMFSHPGETKADVHKTFGLMEELKRYPFVRIGTFQPTMIFPGSELEVMARERGMIGREFSWYEPYDSALNRRLAQIPNVPLFVDLLTPGELVELSDRGKRLLLTARERAIRAVGLIMGKVSRRAFLKTRKLYRRLNADLWLGVRRKE
jgi:anaerobic magnesium-protoporphyrin IX monomethyl ester cyclase